MATPTARAIQKAEALQRLTVAADALAAALDVAPPSIPTHHKDAAHLQTVQMDALADFLETVCRAVETTPEPMPPLGLIAKPAAKKSS